MKTLDVKSLLIGALLTSTIFLGVAATSKDDAGKWDDKQQWQIDFVKDWNSVRKNTGWELFAVTTHDNNDRDDRYWMRKRIK